MTRRLVLALLATVLMTLLAAGAVTLALARWQAHDTTEQRLRSQAESVAGIATIGSDAAGTPREQQIARRVVRELRAALRVDGVELALIGPAGRLQGDLPDGVQADDLDIAALQAGTTLSGSHGSLVWAAAPEAVRNSTVVAVVTADAGTDLATGAKWFVVAAAATTVLGAVVAVVLGRRLARPVRDASDAAHRLAAGDLATRLPEPSADDRDELADLARSINAMAAGLERARTLDRQFLLSISHDLRTPLTSIRGYAEAIADGAAPDAADAAGVIAAEAERLDRLVADLLTLARLDGRAFTMHPVAHDLGRSAGNAVRAFAPTAEAARLVVTMRDAGEPMIVLADPERVQQVLGNLLTNAAKFARSRIDVSVSSDAVWWLLRVDDDGPGIPPDERAHVFQRLYAARPVPVRAGAGSGLGLAIVHQLVAAMDGEVAVDEAPAGGARLEVRLPRASVAAAVAAPTGIARP